ncbi:hypothetical protein HYQ44_006536 [Verticillium longisporum]|nr:hypothetical protein HYQ44_006536 [Verticillium longisporum]
MTIACEAMDAIYAPNSKLSSHEMEAIVTKADVELRSHYGALPTYLRLTASTQTPMLPHVCLYHVQYHAHLILLHRPLMQGRNKNCVDILRQISRDCFDNTSSIILCAAFPSQPFIYVSPLL